MTGLPYFLDTFSAGACTSLEMERQRQGGDGNDYSTSGDFTLRARCRGTRRCDRDPRYLVAPAENKASGRSSGFLTRSRLGKIFAGHRWFDDKEGVSMPGTEGSLYTRLGGYDAIVAVVDDLQERLESDPLLGRY
jgi:hypothetical protein